MEIKYGEQEILDFDINNPENFWPNKHEKNYTIDRAGGYSKVFFKMVFVGFAGSFVCRFGGSVVFVLVGLGY